MHAIAITPAGTLGAVVVSPSVGSLPRYHGVSAPASLHFEACSAFTRVTACMLAKSPNVTRYIEVLQRLCYLRRRSDCYRLERLVAGRGSHPLKTKCLGTAYVIMCNTENSVPQVPDVVTIRSALCYTKYGKSSFLRSRILL
jgi:hypothetical protein